MVDLALLGCGGGMPMPNRFLSALLINYRGRKILIDCGEGTQVSMRMLGWGFKSIDVIAITHGHGDHTVGLPGLLATIGNSGRTEPITIIGPEGIGEIIRGFRVIVPYLPYDIKLIENPIKEISFNFLEEVLYPIALEQDSIESNSNSLIKEDLIISTLSLEHSAPCLGYSFYINRRPKFDMGKAEANNVPKCLWNNLQKGQGTEYEGIQYKPSMVLGRSRNGIKLSYITDTRPLNSMVDFIKNSDLFICEGTYGSDEDLHKAIKNKHMTFSEAAKLAYDGNVKELILTHFSPAMTEPEEYANNAKNIYKNTIIGKDRMIKTLNFLD